MTNGPHAYRIWRAALGELEVVVTRPAFETWLARTRGVGLEDQTLIVEAPSTFAVEWLQRRMNMVILKTIRRVSGENLKIQFRVAGSSQEPHGDAQGAQSNKSHQVFQVGSTDNLNRRFTFANFVVGGSNELAASAAQAVAHSPGTAYNPLFIYSGVGLGKTHLLQGIAHSCLMQGARAAYTTSERFTNEFIQGIRNRTTDEFRSKYRNVDVLLIDDIQFLAGKEQTQEGFFHTFNELHGSNRQVVMTSDRPPRALDRLEERLVSRFESGLVVDIQPPCFETRLAILRSKAEHSGARLEDGALELMAQRLTTNNIRTLEGALNFTLALSGVKKEPICREMVLQALDKMGGGIALVGTSVSPEKLIATVALFYSLRPEDMAKRKRTRNLTTARQMAMYLLQQDLKLGVTEIGRMLSRDHSTVIHGVDRVAKALLSDAGVLDALSAIRKYASQ